MPAPSAFCGASFRSLSRSLCFDHPSSIRLQLLRIAVAYTCVPLSCLRFLLCFSLLSRLCLEAVSVAEGTARSPFSYSASEFSFLPLSHKYLEAVQRVPARCLTLLVSQCVTLLTSMFPHLPKRPWKPLFWFPPPDLLVPSLRLPVS